MNKIRVIIVDDCLATLMKYAAGLRESGIDVIAVANNGQECLDILGTARVDIVLIDVVMPKMDGFELAETIKKRSLPAKTVLMTEVVIDYFISKSVQAGAYFITNKDCNYSDLAEKLAEAVKEEKPSITMPAKYKEANVTAAKSTRSLEERISDIFIAIGIPAHIKGYQYLRDAIIIGIEQPYAVNSITKTVYPALAIKYSTSPTRVERAIRHAIEVAWTRGRVENINRLFGFKVFVDRDRPTNGEFIALVADKLAVETKQRAS